MDPGKTEGSANSGRLILQEDTKNNAEQGHAWTMGRIGRDCVKSLRGKTSVPLNDMGHVTLAESEAW